MKVGKISFTNVFPLYEKLELSDLPVEMISAVPSVLNRMLKSGEIQASSISSYAYAESWQDYLVLPGISVSAKEAVGSIFLFTNGCKFSELHGKKVALTDQSATSINLLRVILEKYVGVQPVYLTREPKLEEMLSDCEAALLIGDTAIQAKWSYPGKKCYDLGKEWHRFTGESMTYAIWVVREETLVENRETLHQLTVRMVEAKEAGLEAIDQVILRAQDRLGGEASFWKSYYLEHLDYDFATQEVRGLARYFQDLREIGILSDEIPIRMALVNGGEQER